MPVVPTMLNNVCRPGRMRIRLRWGPGFLVSKDRHVRKFRLTCRFSIEPVTCRGAPGGGGFLGAPYAPYGMVSKYEAGHRAENTKGLAPDPGHLVLHDISLDRMRGRRE